MNLAVMLMVGSAAACAVLGAVALLPAHRLPRLRRLERLVAPARRRRHITLPMRPRQAMLDVPTFLMEVAAGLRAGETVEQSLARYAEGAGLLAAEVGRVLRRHDHGLALEEALEQLHALGNQEVSLAVQAIGLCRNTGGDLPVVLSQLALLCEERLWLSQEIRTQFTEARQSAVVLIALPPLLLFGLWLLSPGQAMVLIDTAVGRGALVYSILSWLLGCLLLQRLLRTAGQLA